MSFNFFSLPGFAIYCSSSLYLLAWSFAMLELVVVPHSGAAYRIVEFTILAPTWLRALFVRKGLTVFIIAIFAFIAFIMLFLPLQIWLSKLMFEARLIPSIFISSWCFIVVLSSVILRSSFSLGG